MSPSVPPTLYWVRGPAAGALYDLQTGRVHAVPPEYVSFVERAVDLDLPLARLTDGARVHRWLECCDLGGYRIRPLAQRVRLDGAPRLLWLELTGRCNYTCVHCYAESDPAPRADELSAERWAELLDEAAALGFRQVQLTGGDPAMHPALPELIERAAALPFELVELYTNASLLTDRLIDRLARHGIHLAASFYSADPCVYDSITGVPGSHARAVRGLKRALARQIPVRIGLVEMPQNIHDVEVTLAFLSSLGIPRERVTRDRVRPAGRGRRIEGCGNGATAFVAVSDIVVAGANTGFRRPQPLPVAARVHDGVLVWNTCWSGELAIDPHGDVYPCIFARNTPLGSVADASLADCLRSTPVRQAWEHNLGDSDDCAGCEFRYACFDCRALTVNATGRTTAKPPTCIYDPATGRVDAGEWVRRLDAQAWAAAVPVTTASWRVVAEDGDGPWIDTDRDVQGHLSWFGAAVLDLVDGRRSVAGITAVAAQVAADVTIDMVLAALFELEVQGFVALPEPQPAAIQ